MYNPKSPGVKRLMKEAKELAEPTEEYFAYPLEDNIFEWHFTVRGPPGTEFEGGYYHGRILLPTQYPMKPPNIILLTPNGRFETNKKICLSISEHHPETWQPSWSIRTALLALIAFMPSSSAGTIGSLDYTPEERKTLARRSRQWECSVCGGGCVASKLLVLPTSNVKQLPSDVGEAVVNAAQAAMARAAAAAGFGGGGAADAQDKDSMPQTIAFKVEDDSLQKPSSERLNVNGMVASIEGGTSDSTLVRRHVVDTPLGAEQHKQSSTSVVTEASMDDSLLNASIQSSKRDQLWSVIIWFLVLSISLLVIRRLFFL